MKKKNKIPRFKNIKDEAEFWEKNSLADYWSEFKDMNLLVEINKPKTETVILRLNKDLKSKLEFIARSSGVNLSTLIRFWLTEKLAS